MTDSRNLPLDDLASELAAVLVSQQARTTIPELVSSKVQRNPYSYTCRLEYADGDETSCYYVKVPIIDKNNENVVYSRLKAEFDRLRSLRDSFEDDAQLSVAAPIAYFERYPALVTEEVSGEPLHDIMVRQTRRFGRRSRSGYDLEALCRLTGRWLNRLQAKTAVPRSIIDVDDVREYCRIRLDSILKLQACPIDREFKSRLLSHLEELGRAASPEDVRSSLRHNDFAPHNIIAGHDEINVLDFTMCDYGEAFYDITSFWERLESFGQDPLHDSKLVARLQSAFLDGLGRPLDLDSPGMRIGRSKFYVTQLAACFDKSSLNPYQRWRDHRTLKRTLGWLTDELARAI